ncbi:MAG: glycosyltransferase family 2 protein [Candidatus Omnitrophota bacterium]
MTRQAERNDISIIVPLKNEEDNVGKLVREIEGVLFARERSFEIILVDDCSTDDTVFEAESLRKLGPCVHVYSNPYSGGQCAAIFHGFRNSSGMILVTIDGDGQNNPADIPRIIEALEKGFDFVGGWRQRRKDPLFRKAVSFLANSAFFLKTGIRLRDYNCGFNGVSRALMERISPENDQLRFMKAVLVSKAALFTEIPVDHRKRAQGRSKYGFAAIMKTGMDFWFNFRCIKA